MADKYLYLNGGVPTQRELSQTSAGAGDAGKGVALNSSGKIDDTMLPTVETQVVPASENLAAGDYVNLWDDSSTLKARKADASGGVAKKADGYVKAAVTAPASATVYKGGENDQDSGLTLGLTHYLSATPGAATATAPTTTGHIVQVLGKAVSATEMMVDIQESPYVA